MQIQTKSATHLYTRLFLHTGRSKLQPCELFLNQCFALTLLNLDHPAGLSSYTDGSKTEPHEEVEGGAGLAPGDVHAAAAMVQHSLTQVRTLLHLLLKQQVAELGET